MLKLIGLKLLPDTVRSSVYYLRMSAKETTCN